MYTLLSFCNYLKCTADQTSEYNNIRHLESLFNTFCVATYLLFFLTSVLFNSSLNETYFIINRVYIFRSIRSNSQAFIYVKVGFISILKRRIVADYQGKVTSALRRAYLGCKSVAHSKCVEKKEKNKYKIVWLRQTAPIVYKPRWS